MISKHTIGKVLEIIFNIFVFLSLSCVIIAIWWVLAGKDYLLSSQPMGGDYFNALTYANFFNDHLSLPPNGWIPFWNEGSPIIGGYPWFMFYLMYPLTRFFDIASSMEIFSAGSLVLFFLASFLLFWQVAKNWLIAGALTLIVTTTKATYYPLVTGGFISSATAQWYLPIVLFFIYRFSETKKNLYLVLSSLFAGLSLLHHAPTSLLMIVLPSTVALALMPNFRIKKRISALAAFLISASLVGSMGLYTVFLQMYLGSGSGSCASPECWGVYPKHLTLWMNPLAPMVVGGFLIVYIVVKLFKKSMSLSLALPATGGFAFLILYLLAAKLHLINGLANVIFPTRIFWAVTLFILVIAAGFFHSLRTVWPRFSYLVALVTTVFVSLTLLPQPKVYHQDRINTDPVDVATYVVPKYQSRTLNELIPEWLPLNETNWRLDTFNTGLTHWWNFVALTPSTRGYSNHPIGVHRDWQYFLQVATRDPQGKNEELIRNRALFLLDAFGIGYHENSIASYPQSVISDSAIITKNDQKRDFVWSQFSPQVVSPIVSPTNSNAVLFIGDNSGYENFIRTIAMTNLNSFLMIPIKGAESIDGINSEELKQFKAVILYRFTGGNWSNVTSYVKSGGMVFIETGTQDLPKGKLEELFPIQSLTTLNIQGELDATGNTKSEIVNTINLEDFSPFVFENGPWKLSTSSISNIRPWAQALLTKENQVLLAQGNFAKGQVIWSGMNLFFHIVQNDNLQEAKLFKNILSFVLAKKDIKPTFTVERPDPEHITIEGKNFEGIYFKENYHSGWKARVYPKGNRRMNGNQIPIYKAGLDFMYIPIPKNLQDQPLHVSISYVGNIATWTLFFISTFSFIFSFLYVLFPQPFQLLTLKASNYFRINVIQRTKNWLEKE